MIVTVIIALLAVLAYPAFVKVRRSAQNSRFVSDVRVFAQAFESYSMETGLWPPNAGTGVVPAGMNNSFRRASWVGVNSLGGRWNWDLNNFGFVAGISIVNVTATDYQMTLIDKRIDDGDLSTGLFRKVSANRYSYILQE